MIRQLLEKGSIPSRSDQNVEKLLFSVDSSRTTNRRLPELLRAFTVAKKQARRKARHHRILKRIPHSGAGHQVKAKRKEEVVGVKEEPR